MLVVGNIAWAGSCKLALPLTNATSLLGEGMLADQPYFKQVHSEDLKYAHGLHPND